MCTVHRLSILKSLNESFNSVMVPNELTHMLYVPASIRSHSARSCSNFIETFSQSIKPQIKSGNFVVSRCNLLRFILHAMRLDVSIVIVIQYNQLQSSYGILRSNIKSTPTSVVSVLFSCQTFIYIQVFAFIAHFI